MSGSPLDSKLFFSLVYNNNTTSIVDPYIFVSLGPTIYKGNANTQTKRCCVFGDGCISCIDRRYLEKSTHFELRRVRSWGRGSSLRWWGCCGWGGGENLMKKDWWINQLTLQSLSSTPECGGWRVTQLGRSVCLVVVVTKMSNVCLSLALCNYKIVVRDGAAERSRALLPFRRISKWIGIVFQRNIPLSKEDRIIVSLYLPPPLV